MWLAISSAKKPSMVPERSSYAIRIHPAFCAQQMRIVLTIWRSQMIKIYGDHWWMPAVNHVLLSKHCVKMCEACFSVQTVTMAPARVLLEWILSQSRIKKQQRINDAASWKEPTTSHYVTSWIVWRRLLVKWESFFPEKLTSFGKKKRKITAITRSHSWVQKPKPVSDPGMLTHNLIYIYVKLLYIRFTPHPGFQSPPRLVFIFVGKTYKPLFATGILGEGRSNIKGGTNYCGPEKASLLPVGLELVNSGAPNKFPLRKGMENP